MSEFKRGWIADAMEHGRMTLEQALHSWGQHTQRILTMELDFYKGKEVAETHANLADFDVDQAIASFEDDPADSAFQRGYLHGLLKSGYASTY